MTGIRLLVVLLAMQFLMSSAPAQTDAERANLRMLGSGYVVSVYQGNIVRTDIDTTGHTDTSIIYYQNDNDWQDHPVPCVSDCGQYVYFRKSPDHYNCEVWRMKVDGSEKERFVTQSYPYAQHFRQSWTSPYRLVFASSTELYQNLWNHPNIYVVTPDRSVEEILDLGTATVDNLDLSGNMLTYRQNRSTVYVHDLASNQTTEIRRGCGQCFNLTGGRLIVNKGGHHGYYYYACEDDGSWKVIDSADYNMQLNPFRWSNHPDWATVRTEVTTPPMAFAINPETGERIRIVFHGVTGDVTSINLFLHSARSGIKRGVSHKSDSWLPPRDEFGRVYDIRGRVRSQNPRVMRNATTPAGVYIYNRKKGASHIYPLLNTGPR